MQTRILHLFDYYLEKSLASIALSIACLLSSSALAQTNLNIIYTAGGGDSLWNNPLNWDITGFGPGVPENTPSIRYSVFIDNSSNANSVVFQNVNANINNINISLNDILVTQTGRSLTLNNQSNDITFVNDGQYILQSQNGQDTRLHLTRTTNLIGTGGAGRLILQDAASISGSGHDVLLRIQAGQTIEGENSNGSFGVGVLGIQNDGLIVASMSNKRMLIQPGSMGFLNTGTVRASNGGYVVLSGSFANRTFSNSPSGVMEALAGTRFEIKDSARLSGGTLTGAGTFEVSDGQLSDLVNNSTIISRNGTITGTITNNGLIEIAPIAQNNLFISGNATLTGTGTLRLDGADTVRHTLSASTLTNGAGHTIEGETSSNLAGPGSLGGVGQSLAIVNQGLIHGNVNGQQLIINPGSAGMSNSGTIRASNGGAVVLSGSSSNRTFTSSSSGVLEANAGSKIVISETAQVSGGTLNGAGTFEVVGSGSVLSNFINNSTVVSLNGTLAGNITNNGLIRMGTVPQHTLHINGATTLGGNGTLRLAGANLVRQGSLIPASLTNGVNHTIEGETSSDSAGSGSLGANQVTLINNGLIHANVSGQSLIVDTAGTTFANMGTLKASNDSTLMLMDQLTQAMGRIELNQGTLDATAPSGQPGIILTGGELAGTGTVNDSLRFADDALIDPGFSPGLLNIAGNLHWDAGGKIDFDLGLNAAASDLISISGMLLKEGSGTYEFNFKDNGWVIGQTYQLMTFSGTNFQSSDFSNVDGLTTGTFSISGSSLQYTVSAVPEPGSLFLLFGAALAWSGLRRRA